MALLKKPFLIPRTRPKIRARYYKYAKLVEVVAHEYVLGDGTVLPAESLKPLFISNSVDNITGDMHEYYALMARGGDPEAFMDFLEYFRAPFVGVIDCSVTRCCGTALDVYFDGELKDSFPARSKIGYTAFRVKG